MKAQHSRWMRAALLATYATVVADAAFAQSSTGKVLERESQTPAGPETNEQKTNRFEFISGPEAERHWAKLRGQLRDPEQRKQLWQQNRAALKGNHPELGESIGIDPETEERLLDLLANHELDRLALTAHSYGDMQAHADFETRRLESLRALLGEAGAERYLRYAETLHERRQVAELDDMLSPADKLRAEQKERLVALLSQELRRRVESTLRGRDPRDLLEPPVSMELENIANNERALRLMEDSHRELFEETRTFLSDSQHATLTRMKRDEERGLRQWIEEARLRAGLSPVIPEREEPEPSARAKRIPLVTDLSLEITVKVNRAEPKRTEVTVSSGSSVMIEGGDGLWIEATPTLYEDHWLVVDLSYYELGPNGEKELIHKGGSFASLTQFPDGSLSGGGGGGTTIVGKKGYAVEVFAKLL